MVESGEQGGMMGRDETSRGRYACGCRVGSARLNHGVTLPMPICSRHGLGYGRATVAARFARSAFRRFGILLLGLF